MSERSDLIVILDRSGSMQERRADHEGGLRSFVRDSRRLVGDVRLTFVRFDSHEPCEVVFEAVPVADVKEEALTLVPRGGTPLLDAVGEALTRFGAFPGPVVAMVITDGQENQSRTWTKEAVRKLVASREAAGWKVLYLGANVDEFAEAGGIGIATPDALGYSDKRPGTIKAAYASLAANLSTAYAVRAAGTPWSVAARSLNWTADQRRAATTNDTEEES